jgi:hypothetical protein
LIVATTHRATRIEREENITARLLDIISAVEVLALLTDDPADHQRLMTILEETLQLKQVAIARRNRRA